MRVYVEFEELWEPWEMSDEEQLRHGQYEIPEELVERFRRARAEIEAVWDELRNVMGAQDT